MNDSIKRLKRDLVIVEAMASEMDEYLRSQTLFWPMMKGNLPRLTIGGYLMRQHRLVMLKNLMDEAESDRLGGAIILFNDALVEKIVRFEQRAHTELHARLRQWGEYLKELYDPSLGMADFYHSHVQNRVMIKALIDKLEMPPYEIDERIYSQLETYDNLLRKFWVPGSFTWPSEWQPAYPKDHYWWLYGHPRK
jgi:hypothetical protein